MGNYQTGSQQTLSSSGEPVSLPELKNKLLKWAAAGLIPPMNKPHLYKLYTWQSKWMEHESIVVVPVKSVQISSKLPPSISNHKHSNHSSVASYSNHNQHNQELILAPNMGSFTIEMKVDPDAHKLWIVSNYVSYDQSKQMMNNNESSWTAIGDELFSKPLHSKKLIIETNSENFIDLADSLIKEHGLYASLGNNCQVFVNGFIKLLCHQFRLNGIVRADYGPIAGDGDIVTCVALGMLVTFPVMLSIDYANRKWNKNNYEKVFKKAQTSLMSDQIEKVVELCRYCPKLSSDQATKCLGDNQWNMTKAKLNAMKYIERSSISSHHGNTTVWPEENKSNQYK